MSFSLKAPASGIWSGGTTLMRVGETALLAYESTTLGRPVAAPSGTFAETLRLAVSLGRTLMLPPSFALNITLRTSLRWRPESCNIESVVALCIPPHVLTQTASLSSGGSAGVVPPPAGAQRRRLRQHVW